MLIPYPWKSEKSGVTFTQPTAVPPEVNTEQGRRSGAPSFSRPSILRFPYLRSAHRESLLWTEIISKHTNYKYVYHPNYKKKK